MESLGIGASGSSAQPALLDPAGNAGGGARDETAVVGEPGINLTRLIEVFSRQARSQQPSNVLETRPRAATDQEDAGSRLARRVNRLRNRLIFVFLAATLAPVAATLWLTTSLLDRSLSYSYPAEIDELSRSLEVTGRELYQRTRDSLKTDASAGRLKPSRDTPRRSAPCSRG